MIQVRPVTPEQMAQFNQASLEMKVDATAFEAAMRNIAAAMKPVVEALTKFAEWYEAIPAETRAMLHDELDMPPVGFSEDQGHGMTLAELLGEIDSELSELPNTHPDNG